MTTTDKFETIGNVFLTERENDNYTSLVIPGKCYGKNGNQCLSFDITKEFEKDCSLNFTSQHSLGECEILNLQRNRLNVTNNDMCLNCYNPNEIPKCNGINYENILGDVVQHVNCVGVNNLVHYLNICLECIVNVYNFCPCLSCMPPDALNFIPSMEIELHVNRNRYYCYGTEQFDCVHNTRVDYKKKSLFSYNACVACNHMHKTLYSIKYKPEISSEDEEIVDNIKFRKGYNLTTIQKNLVPFKLIPITGNVQLPISSKELIDRYYYTFANQCVLCFIFHDTRMDRKLAPTLSQTSWNPFYYLCRKHGEQNTDPHNPVRLRDNGKFNYQKQKLIPFQEFCPNISTFSGMKIFFLVRNSNPTGSAALESFEGLKKFCQLFWYRKYADNNTYIFPQQFPMHIIEAIYFKAGATRTSNENLPPESHKYPNFHNAVDDINQYLILSPNGIAAIVMGRADVFGTNPVFVLTFLKKFKFPNRVYVITIYQRSEGVKRGGTCTIQELINIFAHFSNFQQRLTMVEEFIYRLSEVESNLAHGGGEEGGITRTFSSMEPVIPHVNLPTVVDGNRSKFK